MTYNPDEQELEMVELEPEQPQAPEAKPAKNDLDDLFEVPQPDDNDMEIDDLFSLEEEDDMGDLVDVSREDITGYPSEKKMRILPRGRRIVRREQPPSLGRMRL